MNETAKNYEDRVKNGDFKKYLHGNGIDIGGGADCLVLPSDIEGTVELFDFNDGDAQYMRKYKDCSFDFVYSSHCLEHMRNLEVAFTNWIRICTLGGYIYTCVPHETYYEKGIWPSINNLDHKHSFTISSATTMPANVVITDFLKKFESYIDIIEIRENLKNYDFSMNSSIDQTANTEKAVCAQIDFIVRKRNDLNLTLSWRIKNELRCIADHIIYIFPLKVFNHMPINLQNRLKEIVRSRNKKRQKG